MKSLCTKFEVILSQKSNNMGFCAQIYHKIKLKTDAVPFRRTYFSMRIEENKSHETNCWRLGTRRFSRINTFRLGSTIITCIKKNWTYRLVVDYRGLNLQIEKTCRPLSGTNEVIDSLEKNLYFSNIDLLSGYFQMRLEEESQNLTAFITPPGLYM